MRYLSLFSGIEAATVAWQHLGWECVAVAEIEPFPCRLLAHHYPDVPNLGDVTKITKEQIEALGHIDVVIFGSPCQDLSMAGKRKGLKNEDGSVTRSGLFFAAIDIFRWSGARFALWENVPGAYSSNKGRDFAAVVSEMAGLDNLDVPRNGWGTAGCAVGDNGLLEWACLDAQFAGLAQRRKRVFAILDTGDWANRPPILLIAESVRGSTAPSREKGEEVAGTIVSCARNPSINENHLIACMATGNTNAEILTDLSPTLTCAHEQPIIAYGIAGNVIGRKPENGGNGTGYSEELSYTLTKTDQHGVCYRTNNKYEVRRLTVLESERLQGFPDGYTNIPKCSDSARYKSLGNSMAVPIIRYIGQQIESACA